MCVKFKVACVECNCNCFSIFVCVCLFMSFLNHQTIVYENLQSKVTMIMEKSRQCPSRFDLCDISDEISDDKDMTSTVIAKKWRFIFGTFFISSVYIFKGLEKI